MMTHGSFLTSSASSPAVIRTSVMAASPVAWLLVLVVPNLFEHDLFGKPVPAFPDHASAVRQHLAQLLGGGRDDGDEIGFAKPALGAVAHQVAARAAMEHRRMRDRDAGIADAQPQRDDPAPVAVIAIVGI